MLQWTCDTDGPRFCVYVHYTDAERNGPTTGIPPLAALDKGLDEAASKDWTVVDMKGDWAKVFPAP